MIDQVRKMADVFKALGDPTRLSIIRMLASNPKDTLCVADLAARLGSTQPAASQNIMDFVWLDNHTNLLFFGPPGIGKTHPIHSYWTEGHTGRLYSML